MTNGFADEVFREFEVELRGGLVSIVPDSSPYFSMLEDNFPISGSILGERVGIAPVRPPRNGDQKGEVREHCLSPRRGRVAQRPFWSSTAGKSEGPAHRGATAKGGAVPAA